MKKETICVHDGTYHRTRTPWSTNSARWKVLICAPTGTSHAKISPEERRRIGISDSLLRLSVGIEDADDLMADLDQAMKEV